MTDEEIAKIVTEAFEYKEKENAEVEYLREKYKDEDIFEEGTECKKAWEEHNKRYPLLDIEGKTPSGKLFKLKHDLPIAEDKRCCRNCSYVFCHLRKFDKKHDYICENYNPKDHVALLYAQAVYVKDYKEPTREEKLKQEIKETIDFYHNTLLKEAKEYEVGIKTPVLPMPQKDIENDKKWQKKLKEDMDRWSSCFDKEENIGDLHLTKFTFNKEKAKKLLKEGGRCPMEIATDLVGIKVDK